ncbi:hypothetical protein [Vibrio sp. OPT18]|uniref:hypothetical protein n=1 Tax=Vibrio sp. OPT18 TaxID=2778641 RepID=UPI00187F0345|nr:hypothetical protein [Vibrio sp. OPT18]MBE8574171.1 hypothetical protein [Vibrio sp. OPT18]
MKKTFKYCLLGLAFLPLTSQALGIDSMIRFTEKGRTNFTITSGADYRQFIQVGISQLDVKDGEIVKLPYTRENIDQWSLLVRPARAVIDPKLRKLFQVESMALKSNPVPQDQAYQLSFVPTPYFEKGEPVTHAVKVAMGFAPIVVVPASQDKPIHYEMKYVQDGLTLINNGETYLRAVLDACPEDTKVKERDSCSTVVYALSGRKLPIALYGSMLNASEIDVELSTHNSDYKEAFTLKLGQTSTNKGV